MSDIQKKVYSTAQVMKDGALNMGNDVKQAVLESQTADAVRHQASNISNNVQANIKKVGNEVDRNAADAVNQFGMTMNDIIDVKSDQAQGHAVNQINQASAAMQSQMKGIKGGRRRNKSISKKGGVDPYAETGNPPPPALIAEMQALHAAAAAKKQVSGGKAHKRRASSKKRSRSKSKGKSKKK